MTIARQGFGEHVPEVLLSIVEWHPLLGNGSQPIAKPRPKHRTNAHIDIHALSEIRTHEPSVRANEDSSCLRSHGPV
jgi:hypothetical protein